MEQNTSSHASQKQMLGNRQHRPSAVSSVNGYAWCHRSLRKSRRVECFWQRGVRAMIFWHKAGTRLQKLAHTCLAPWPRTHPAPVPLYIPIQIQRTPENKHSLSINKDTRIIKCVHTQTVELTMQVYSKKEIVKYTSNNCFQYKGNEVYIRR